MLEASTDGVVHGLQGGRVRAGWHNANGIAQPAERSTLAQEVQSHLRVFQGPQRVEEVGGGGDTPLRVLLAELCTADGGPQQFETAVGAEAEPFGEIGEAEVAVVPPRSAPPRTFPVLC